MFHNMMMSSIIKIVTIPYVGSSFNLEMVSNQSDTNKVIDLDIISNHELRCADLKLNKF